MTSDELFADWEARTLAAGFTMADLRRQANVHAANFSNWRNGKGGMTLASIQKIEAALTDLEIRGGVAACGTCDLRAEDPACASCTRSDCGLRQREAA